MGRCAECATVSSAECVKCVEELERDRGRAEADCEGYRIQAADFLARAKIAAKKALAALQEESETHAALNEMKAQRGANLVSLELMKRKAEQEAARHQNEKKRADDERKAVVIANERCREQANLAGRACGTAREEGRKRGEAESATVGMRIERDSWKARAEKAEKERDHLKIITEDTGHCETANAMARLVDERDDLQGFLAEIHDALADAGHTTKAGEPGPDGDEGVSHVECIKDLIAERDEAQTRVAELEETCQAWEQHHHFDWRERADTWKALTTKQATVLSAIKLRLHFVGMPQEPMLEGGLFGEDKTPDWSKQIALIEEVQADWEALSKE